MGAKASPVLSQESTGVTDMRYHRAAGTPLTDKYAVVAARLGTASRVLEVGCHTGYFAQALIAAGHSVIAVEFDQVAADIARRSNIPVVCGDIEDLRVISSVGADFDALVLMDVLEHLRDPLVTLRHLRTLLRPGGKVLITGPNVAYWAMRKDLLLGRWRYVDAGIMDRTHLHFYTAATWRTLVEDAGFRVVDIRPAEGMVPAERLLRGLGASHELIERIRRAAVAVLPHMFTVVFIVEAVR